MLGIHARMVFWKHGVRSGLSVCTERLESWKKDGRSLLTERKKRCQLEHLLEEVVSRFRYQHTAIKQKS